MSLERHATTSAALHNRYPFLGMARCHHTNKRAAFMSFADKPYLIPLYAMLPGFTEAAFCKATQTGLSELLIAYILHESGWNDRICAYVLPQYKTSERFVADRIDPVILRTPAYAARLPGGVLGMEDATGGKGNLKRKRFGRRGSLLFLGSNTPADFIEFSCDVAIIDELDDCDMANIAKIKDRTRESDTPQIFRVSNPRIPGRGISKRWAHGTRARWFHKCGRCGHRQPMDWFKNFVERDSLGAYYPRDRERAESPSLGDIRPVCVRCKRPWERIADGSVWVAEHPSKDEDSIHISRLDVLSSRRDPQPMRSGYKEFIMALTDRQALTAWWAGFLGWTRQDEGTSVTQEAITQASSGPALDYNGGYEYKDKTVVMGVDVGSMLNIKISSLSTTDDERHPYKRTTIWTGAARDFEDLIAMQERYHVDVMVIDALPETRKVKEIRDHFINEGTCQVWLCLYNKTPKVGAMAFGIKMNYEDQTITVDRTQLLDTTLDDLKHGRMILPVDIDTVLHFADQMIAPKRILKDNGRIVWDEGTDPDHYRHADAYERVAVAIHDMSGGYYG